MKTAHDTEFEDWARLLLQRKVPDRFHPLINSEVVKYGASMLEDGDAFEVHLLIPPTGMSVDGIPDISLLHAHVHLTRLDKRLWGFRR